MGEWTRQGDRGGSDPEAGMGRKFTAVTIGLWLGIASPVSAAYINVTQDRPSGPGDLDLGGPDLTVWYHAEETTLLSTLDVPIEMTFGTCAPGTSPVGCQPVDLTNSRFQTELPGATGIWASQTLIRVLGGGAFQSNTTFGITPGIETSPGESFIIGQFAVSTPDIFVTLEISTSEAYGAVDTSGNPIPLSTPRGTEWIFRVPEPGAFLLIGMVLAGMVFLRRRTA